DVGPAVVVFPTKEFSRTAHACLYFVTDQYQILLIAPCTQSLQKFLATGPDTALSLYRLDQDGNGLFASSLFYCLQIVEWNLLKTIWKRDPCGLIGCLPRRSRGC